MSAARSGSDDAAMLVLPLLLMLTVPVPPPPLDVGDPAADAASTSATTVQGPTEGDRATGAPRRTSAAAEVPFPVVDLAILAGGSAATAALAVGGLRVALALGGVPPLIVLAIVPLLAVPVVSGLLAWRIEHIGIVAAMAAGAASIAGMGLGAFGGYFGGMGLVFFGARNNFGDSDVIFAGALIGAMAGAGMGAAALSTGTVAGAIVFFE